jgi:phosphoribosyl-AMP cyclohydrolase
MKVLEENLQAVDFEKGNGLVPVVVQDAKSGKVLMVAYANREALKRTLESGYAHYYSRSRKKLWKKGESSGNLQKVKKVLVDCDGDTLLYIVEQKGVACHTGEYSCFFRTVGEEE